MKNKILVVLGIIISIFLLLTIHINYTKYTAKNQFIKSLYKTRGIVLNPDEIKVEVKDTLLYRKYTNYLKNKYGKDIVFTTIDRNLNFSNDDDFAYFIVTTKINPYLKQKYNFLNDEKVRLENQLEKYNSKYDLIIEPRVVYEYGNEVVLDNYYYRIYETKNSYYYYNDEKYTIYSYNILYDKIKRENIRNINFNEIEPEKILGGIDKPAILVYSDSIKIIKKEIIKLNNFIKENEKNTYITIYPKSLYLEE